ncbi:MAG: coproporphyrinogen dehydrogenase HemZ [Firmicutes bacterium]|nr:coproporphyrinogen dehydrogenase HemZ [Bacillota bacterium]
MYRIVCKTEKDAAALAELAGMFAPPAEFEIVSVSGREEKDIASISDTADAVLLSDDKEENKAALYELLSRETGKTLPWGILTGVRPLKLYRQLCAGSEEEGIKTLRSRYLVSEARSELLRTIAGVQDKMRFSKDPGAVGIYVGIPFCPTRCSYCSFASNPYDEKGSKEYLEALLYEISRISGIIKNKAFFAESIYIGGGTPTSLAEDDFELLMRSVGEAFLGPRTVEFSVEAGRPDTITRAKLDSIKRHGADRISVNPQSMKQRTLELIGRSHRVEDIYAAYDMARTAGIGCINMDLIAGLPEEDAADFSRTLDEIVRLEPENITVHTLAVKRASRLNEKDPSYGYRQAGIVSEMLQSCGERMASEGYLPYYVYRQKHMAANLENTGYSRPGFESVYNVRIMEEDQSIIAFGAGAISKFVDPDQSDKRKKIVRAANVTNYRIYIDRIEEMVERKEAQLR